jgi:hypothetical protein
VYNDSNAMKIPKTIPLIVAALYSLEAAGSELVGAYGKRVLFAVSFLHSIPLLNVGTAAMIFEVAHVLGGKL